MPSFLGSDLSIVDRPNTGYHKTILPQETYVLFEIIERERGGERDRETETETERQRQRQRETDRERQRD